MFLIFILFSLMFVCTVPIEFICQENKVWCGAACLEMIKTSILLNNKCSTFSYEELESIIGTQEELMAELSSFHNDSSFVRPDGTRKNTDPEGFCKSLNLFEENMEKSGLSTWKCKKWKIFEFNTVTDDCRKEICQIIESSGKPIPFLTKNGKHWVLFTGFTSNTSSFDIENTFNLENIYIADPVNSELNFLPRELKNNQENFQYPSSSWNEIFTVVENGKFKDKIIAIVPDINQN